MVTEQDLIDSKDEIEELEELQEEKKPVVQSLSDVGIDLNKTITEYDHLFYIRPEFDIVDDGVRSTDLQFRDEIVDIFEGLISEIPRPVSVLTGSVRDRVEQVMKAASK